MATQLPTMWRPENWLEYFGEVNRRLGGFTGREDEICEAGADAMHKADVDFIKSLGDDVLFLIKSRLKKEDYEAFFGKG